MHNEKQRSKNPGSIGPKQKVLLWIYCWILSSLGVAAQPAQGLIYGEVTLKNGTQYRGQIRWGNDEALWEDIFEASKYERPMLNVLTKREARRVQNQAEEFKFGFMELWEDKSPNQSFAFRCHFGDIAALKPKNDNVVLLKLKNGDYIQLKAQRKVSPNEDIIIYDDNLGQLSLDFRQLASIHFLSTPPNHRNATGDPVYGKVLTTMGTFEGYFTWDGEECLGNDLISGKQKGIKVDLKFKDIAEIKAQNDGSLLSLKSGSTIFLNDHDDVSRGNHGIEIHNLSFGTLQVKWKNFISVTLCDPPTPGRSYDDFGPSKLLRGTVYLRNGANYRGQIIYDLDEIYDLEFLNGYNNEFGYLIPFRMISKIEPQNDKFSMIYLKDGSRFLLGGNADVTAENNGLVLKLPENKAEYIAWREIKSIAFE